MFTFDFIDGDVLRWRLDETGASVERDREFTPTVYVAADERARLDSIRAHLNRFTEVERTWFESWRRGFRHDAEDVLRVDVDEIGSVTRLARDIHDWGAPGTYRLFNVDFSREFRYCLETGTSPVPERELDVIELTANPAELGGESGLRSLTVGNERYTGSPPDVASAVESAIRDADPDVLLVSSVEILERLHATADAEEWAYQLGREPGWQQLASRSTYESYGRVGHSPARYNLPGRVIIDRSNTFMLSQTNLEGCLDLVERSGKPLQELGWASIGNILTAIQIRAATERNVLVPWKAWRPEFSKTMAQLHEADRGGFTFAPEVGVHEGVHELDFSSLYPNIIVTRNVSPEKIRCTCHEGREDVPGLGYAICDERGYLPDVLEPLVNDRDEIKAAIEAASDPERIETLQGRSDAIKWILVSCFGYQGFSNAKFGRIECHEAINAFAREILLDAKAELEASGWHVVHGIVDSIWVTRERNDAEPLDAVARRISETVEIRLEHEAAYDWVAFVPMRTSDAGALTKYFGRIADGGGYKFRGIECRQRSTPPYIERAQRTLIEVLDRTRSPEAVCDRLQRFVAELRGGAVDPNELVIDNRVSKRLEAYTQATRNVAALERAEQQDLEKHPGQHVRYVVTDDSKSGRDRVALAHESPAEYDVSFYVDRLIRAAESVISPLGWREAGIRQRLSTTDETTIDAFVDGGPP